MSEITIEVDKQAKHNIVKLMRHYHTDSYAAIIKKALILLKEVSEADDNQSDLVIKNDSGRQKIFIRRPR